MRNKICWSMLFFLVFIAVITASSLPLVGKAIKKDPQIQLEEKNTIDVLFLGDSEACFAYIPMQLWRDYGIPSYNCGMIAEKIPRVEDILRMSLQCQEPKVVILDTDLLFNPIDWWDTLFADFQWTIPVIRNHDAWKPQEMRKWKNETEPFHMAAGKGYSYVQDSVAAESGLPTELWEVTHVNRDIQWHVERMLEICRDNNAELILVSSPSTQNWSTARHNGIAELAEELAIRFIDLNLLESEVPMDWSKDTFDKGDHVNYFGGEKITAYIGLFLSEVMELEDKREMPEYASWNREMEEYYRSIEKAQSYLKKPGKQ